MDRYVDYSWYEESFLMGRDPVIPSDLFNYYATQASTQIKNNVSLDADLSSPSDEVKAATCEVAEILCRMEGRSTLEGDDMAVPEGVSSERVGEYSVTYANNTASGKAQEQRYLVREALVKWLGVTGLLYRGV